MAHLLLFERDGANIDPAHFSCREIFVLSGHFLPFFNPDFKLFPASDRKFNANHCI
jgi:hypothetical protein